MNVLTTVLDTTTEEGKRAFYEFLKKLKPAVYSVKIIPNKRPISKGQKGYYFGVLLKEISTYTGYDVNDLHEIFAPMFLTIDVEFAGKIEKKVLSLTELSTVQAEEYYARIRMFVLERYNIRLPLPNEASL